MRPRVDLFCISETISLKQAADLLQREGYSRVPVYRETIDTIVGVLFYKDVLAKYAAASGAGGNREDLLAASIKSLVKKVYYCPETKKIASLLQEFRKRQTHMAVVVDEYGGTAGLVTIEDILEEIVGEISDEYDDQEALFSPAPGGGWIVDARMNLLDVEEEMGIKIPQEEDYDTLAGYIFYRVGSIPQAGLVLHHDAFEIEVLKSNDRMVEEVKSSPSQTKNRQKNNMELPLLGYLVSALFGIAFFWAVYSIRLGSFRQHALSLIRHAEAEAREKALSQQLEQQKSEEQLRHEASRLETQEEQLKSLRRQISLESEKLKKEQTRLAAAHKAVEEKKKEAEEALERNSGLTMDEARETLLRQSRRP